MELYIRIVDGQPFEHPIFGDNFRQVFTNVDTDNLPPEFAKFERIEQPVHSVYEVYEGATYEWFDGVIKDVHHVRAMTVEERQAKIDEVKSAFTPTGDGWVFDEEKCAWISPTDAQLEVSGSAPNVIG